MKIRKNQSQPQGKTAFSVWRRAYRFLLSQEWQRYCRNFQSKTLIPLSKNQIFQNFLTYLPTSSYERRATRDGYIFASNTQVALIIEEHKCSGAKQRIAGRKFNLMAGKLLVGWFMECLACKATFIRTTPENASMVDTGDSILVKTRNGNRETRIETVRCPECLSVNVRLMEIGDGK